MDRDIGKQHFNVISFLKTAAIKLRVKSVTLASAAMIYHKVFSDISPEDYDPYLIATTAMYLAGKSEDDYVSPRDVINVCHRTIHPNEPYLEIGEKYWAFRDSVVQCELFLMRMLDFQLRFIHPHKFMLHYFKSVCDLLDPAIVQKVPVTKMCWSVLNDSYHKPICWQYKAEHIAVSIIFFVLQSYGIEVPCNHESEFRWWAVLSDDISHSTIRSIICDIIDVYNAEPEVTT